MVGKSALLTRQISSLTGFEKLSGSGYIVIQNQMMECHCQREEFNQEKEKTNLGEHLYNADEREVSEGDRKET